MNEVELFLKKIRKENPKDYFLIMKFYKKPNSLLYSTKEEVKDGIYYNEDTFNNYSKNMNFFEFLRIFDFSTLNYYELVSLTRLLKNVKIEDELLISELKLKTNIYLKNKYYNEIVPGLLKEEILIRAQTEAITSEKFPFMNVIVPNSAVTKSLLCDNRFLDIVENRLLNEKLNNRMIEDIIYVLSFSIRIATNGYVAGRELGVKESIDNKLKSSFNIIKAKELIQKLLNKNENKKVIKFEIKK